MNELNERPDESQELSNYSSPLETRDDIPREIAIRRIEEEFSESIDQQNVATLKEIPDEIENPDEFSENAKLVGMENTDQVLGYASNLEDPAHVKRGDVGEEIATLIHEDLHRLTHDETRSDMLSSEERRDLYEGITEYFTSKAAKGLHDYEGGECYPEQVENARKLADEVGDEALRNWFFKHELSDEIDQALKRLPE